LSLDIICGAIRTKNVISFYYTGDTLPGLRTVEPHMVAYNPKEALCLSAWFLSGMSKSGTQGFKEYKMDSISQVTVLPQTFPGPRPGYQRDGGKVFHNVRCGL
jgi:predicted DNA-binding transcriptional regulator YafY